MKKSTKKTSIIIASVMAGAALVGTGFAGWVISGSASDTAKGTIGVYEVTDEKITLSNVYWASSQSKTTDQEKKTGKLIFGKPSSATSTTYSWLSATDDMDTQYLTDTLYFTTTNPNIGSTVDSTAPRITVVFTITDNSSNSMKTAIESNYVDNPNSYVLGSAGNTWTNITGQTDNNTDAKNNHFTVAHTENSAEYTYSLSVGFGWGTHFGGDNPITFYNSHSDSEKLSGSETTYASDAKTALEAIAALKDVTYSITITANHG